MSSPVAEFVVAETFASRRVPMQFADPWALLDAPRPALAAGAFLLTVAFGGATLYRFGGRLDEAVAASRARPLLSLVYGVGAYVFVFAVVGYAFSQLRRVGAASGALSTALVVALAAFVLTLVGYGFAVVGAWVARTAGLSGVWPALVGLAGLAAVAFLVAPFAVAVAVWAVVAAFGLGGSARRWVHASEPRPNAD